MHKTWRRRLYNGLAVHAQALAESWKQSWVDPISTSITLLTLAICLALPLGLRVALQQGQAMAAQWPQGGQLSVFLTPTLSTEKRHALEHTFTRDSRVHRVRYQSPEENLQEFMEAAQLPELTHYLPDNPLPGIFTLFPTTQDPATLQDLKAWALKQPGVDDVTLDLDWVLRLNAALKFLERLSIALMALFGSMVVLVVSNTLRLALSRHQEEMVLYALVGATASFIRRPFLYRGLLHGVGSALIASLLIMGLAYWVNSPLQAFFSEVGTSYTLKGISLLDMVVFLAMSGTLGWIGARIATRNL